MSAAGDKTGTGFFQRKSFCIITGASRGIGKEITLQLSKGWEEEGRKAKVVRRKKLDVSFDGLSLSAYLVQVKRVS